MEGIHIPAEQVVPLESVADGVTGLRIAFVNVFGVTHPDGTWTLIDAGVPGSTAMIRSWAETHFGKPPIALVLTHGHFDHVGAAETLARQWQVPVYAHTLEFPYLNGTRSYPPPDPGVGGGAMALLSPLYPRDPINVGDRLHPLPEETASDVLPGWRVIHTPGHTPGHVSFFRESDRTLMVGDAFCSTKAESFFEAALIQEPELHGPPAYFTSDWAAAKRSVEHLASLDPFTVAAGHGKPLSGPGVAQELRELAVRFVQAAIPENKRNLAL